MLYSLLCLHDVVFDHPAFPYNVPVEEQILGSMLLDLQAAITNSFIISYLPILQQILTYDIT